MDRQRPVAQIAEAAAIVQAHDVVGVRVSEDDRVEPHDFFAQTAAQGLANTVIARFPFPPEFPNNEKPRYMRLNFHVLAAANFTAGTISSALVTIVRDDLGNKFAYANYTVA